MATLIDAIDIRRKMYFEFENAPYYCMDVEVSTPTARGGQTLVRFKMRNLLTRAVFDKTFKAGEKFKEPDLETVEASYLYSDGEGSYFLDQTTFETIQLSKEKLGDALDFLLEGAIVRLDKYNGNPIGLQLPAQVELAVELHRAGRPRRHRQRRSHQACTTGNRHRDSRALLRQRRRKGQGPDRDPRVRRESVIGPQLAPHATLARRNTCKALRPNSLP